MMREDRVPDSNVLVRLFGCELRYPEYGLSILSIWWGLWAVLFVEYSPAYATMAAIAPAWVWGIVAMGLGGALIVSIQIGHSGARRCLLLASFAYWLMITAVLGLPNWQRTSLPTYSSIAVFYGMAYLRLSGLVNLK